MKPKIKIIDVFLPAIALICTALVATSCGKSQTRENVANLRSTSKADNSADAGGELTFAINTSNTKVDPTVVGDLGNIYVSAGVGTKETPGTQVEYKFQNAKFSFNDTDSFYHGVPARYWASDDIGYRFYAANWQLPDNTPGAESPKLVFATEFSGGIDKDVVGVYKAYSSSDYKQKVSLHMLHIFSRIGNVTIKAPVNGSVVSNLSVYITPYVGGTFDLISADSFTKGTDPCDKGWSDKTTVTSAINLMGEISTIASGSSVVNNPDLYLIPGTYTISVNYTLTMGDNVQTLHKQGPATIVRGSINTITLTLPDQTLPEIIFEVSVQDWDTNEINNIALVDA